MASSTALSTTSYTRWWRPLRPVEPMYMPGRLRTAATPSPTWRSFEAYDFSAMARPSGGMGDQAIGPPTRRPEAQVEEADHDVSSLPAGGDGPADHSPVSGPFSPEFRALGRSLRRSAHPGGATAHRGPLRLAQRRTW